MIKKPWELSKGELMRLDDSIGYRNGIKIRLIEAAAKVEEKYGRSFDSIYDGELELEEYLSCYVTSWYGRSLATEDWEAYREVWCEMCDNSLL